MPSPTSYCLNNWNRALHRLIPYGRRSGWLLKPCGMEEYAEEAERQITAAGSHIKEDFDAQSKCAIYETEGGAEAYYRPFGYREFYDMDKAYVEKLDPDYSVYLLPS